MINKLIRSIAIAMLTVYVTGAIAQQLISAPVVATPVSQQYVQQPAQNQQPMPNAQNSGRAANYPTPILLYTQPSPSFLPVENADVNLTQTIAVSRRTTGVVDIVKYEIINGARVYEPIDVQVLDILDRGELLLQTKEQIRIRGARVPSERSNSSVDVIYAREANEWMKSVLLGKDVTLDFLDSPRDPYGNLYGKLTFGENKDDLLSVLLEKGYARLDEDDLWTSAPVEQLRALQAGARKKHLGVWSDTTQIK